MVAKNATSRFSSRVDDYIRYRPQYPVEIIDLLAARCGLVPDSVIADIGSGTGILTRLFLDNGNPVIAASVAIEAFNALKVGNVHAALEALAPYQKYVVPPLPPFQLIDGVP